MAIPKFEEFLLPVLEYLAQQGSVDAARQALPDPIADRMKISEEFRHLRLPSGFTTTLRSRVGWALTYLKKAGLLTSERRGQFAISPRGRDFLKRNASGFGVKALSEFPEFVEFQTVNASSRENSSEEITEVEIVDPDSRIDVAIKEIRRSVADELLESLSKVHPSSFEQIVLDLLVAMGYGGKLGGIEHTGGTGDFGIDGIVSMDRLGLEKIYVQAKRWKSNVGSEAVQSFFGAITGRRARKGILITTSKFTPQAIQFARDVSDSLRLVDGTELADLMIDFEVGVTNKKRISIPTIDRDYFE
jgi:restriction system protein